ncbi:uncharacterized protein SPAPADRAFT_64731 [Spathaspora passalidarum NRRL Y-27907]|uniref:Uncharacterized protein n=1 Tax=Spathaspora passalidarum (strain NRRL Y-27907 / 11-Y1) TaxID=619300 RepID=G3AEA2_SPAPN|nr:uncharacterized protein SPAPADRAFT_64731 [Spathaspora passalidarum NRRL Y-27907]EGW35636.1 hypothetical protein SPAPADRAFT_64731 [Spathaspora passalidarum NRRL Y-27907]
MKFHHFEPYGQPIGFHRPKFFLNKDLKSQTLEEIISKLDSSTYANPPLNKTTTSQSLTADNTSTVETSSSETAADVGVDDIVGAVKAAACESQFTIKQSKRARFKKWMENAKSKGFIVDVSKDAAVDSGFNSNLVDCVCPSKDTNTIDVAPAKTPNTNTSATTSINTAATISTNTAVTTSTKTAATTSTNTTASILSPINTDTTSNINTDAPPSTSVSPPHSVAGSKRAKVKGWFTKIMYGDSQTNIYDVGSNESETDDTDVNDKVIFIDYFTSTSTDSQSIHSKTNTAPSTRISKRAQVKQWFKGFIYPQTDDSDNEQSNIDSALADTDEKVDSNCLGAVGCYLIEPSCANNDVNSFTSVRCLVSEPSYADNSNSIECSSPVYSNIVTDYSTSFFQQLKHWFVRLVFGREIFRDTNSMGVPIDRDYPDNNSDYFDYNSSQPKNSLNVNNELTSNYNGTYDNVCDLAIGGEDSEYPDNNPVTFDNGSSGLEVDFIQRKLHVVEELDESEGSKTFESSNLNPNVIPTYSPSISFTKWNSLSKSNPVTAETFISVDSIQTPNLARSKPFYFVSMDSSNNYKANQEKSCSFMTKYKSNQELLFGVRLCSFMAKNKPNQGLLFGIKPCSLMTKMIYKGNNKQ